MNAVRANIGETLWRLLDEARGVGLFPVTDVVDRIAALRQEEKRLVQQGGDGLDLQVAERAFPLFGLPPQPVFLKSLLAAAGAGRAGRWRRERK